jgi:hypothetical protein
MNQKTKVRLWFLSDMCIRLSINTYIATFSWLPEGSYALLDGSIIHLVSFTTNSVEQACSKEDYSRLAT